MNRAKMITDDVSIHAFHAGIFISRADVLSPVVLYPMERELQLLRDAVEDQKNLSSVWASCAGPAGIGQYSLRYGTPTGVLARYEVHGRDPVRQEMFADFEDFGEQVLGPSVAEMRSAAENQYRRNPVFDYAGEAHYFTGPLRIVKAVFISRVFTGEVPEDITDVIEELDTLKGVGDKIGFGGYHFLHARNGCLQEQTFRNKEAYKPEALESWGRVEMKGVKMVYYPSRGNSIDFTSMIHR